MIKTIIFLVVSLLLYSSYAAQEGNGTPPTISLDFSQNKREICNPKLDKNCSSDRFKPWRELFEKAEPLDLSKLPQERLFFVNKYGTSESDYPYALVHFNLVDLIPTASLAIWKLSSKIEELDGIKPLLGLQSYYPPINNEFFSSPAEYNYAENLYPLQLTDDDNGKPDLYFSYTIKNIVSETEESDSYTTVKYSFRTISGNIIVKIEICNTADRNPQFVEHFYVSINIERDSVPLDFSIKSAREMKK